MCTTDITRHKVTNTGDKDKSATDITRYRDTNTTDMTLDKDRIPLPKRFHF